MNFETAINRVLGAEGKYVCLAADPGGETNWGISKRSYPKVDIKNLTRDGAKAIYLRDFWTPVVQSTTDAALQFQLLDAAVNHGIDRAVRFLQRAVGAAEDGHWGPLSKAALAAQAPADSHLLFMAARFEFWALLSTFPSFGRGWMNRGAQDLRYLAQDNLA
jgi:lysozyme family protein